MNEIRQDREIMINSCLLIKSGWSIMKSAKRRRLIWI